MRTLKVLRDVGDMLFPRLCVACQMPLLRHEQIVCLNCRITLPRTDFGAYPDNPVAKKFWGKVPVEGAVAMLHFHKGSKVQSLMHALKYRDRKDVGVLLGTMLGQYMRMHHICARVDCVSTVPLHADKLALRGYNQSDLIAEGVSAVLQVPMALDLLMRTQFTGTQTKKSRLERWDNVKDVFAVKDPTAMPGRHILLIDDVITTGSTLEACAQTLLAIPEIKVSIAAVAYAEQ